MIITCEECQTSFRLDESLLKPKGTKVRCSICSRVFRAYPAQPAPQLMPADAAVASHADGSSDMGQYDLLDPDMVSEIDESQALQADLDMDMDGNAFNAAFAETDDVESQDTADDFGLNPDDFDIPDTDEPTVIEEPSEADLQLTADDLDLVMDYQPDTTAEAPHSTMIPNTEETATGDIDALDDADIEGFHEELNEEDLDLSFGLEPGQTLKPKTETADGSTETQLSQETQETPQDALSLDLNLEETSDPEAASSASEELDLDLNFDTDIEPDIANESASADEEELDLKLDFEEDPDISTEDEDKADELDLELELEDSSEEPSSEENELHMELSDDQTQASQIDEASNEDDFKLDLDLDALDEEALDSEPAQESEFELNLEEDQPQDKAEDELQLDLESGSNSDRPSVEEDQGFSLDLDLDENDQPMKDQRADNETMDLDLDLELEGETAKDTNEEKDSDDLDFSDLEELLESESGTNKLKKKGEIIKERSSEALSGDDSLMNSDDELDLGDLESILDEDEEKPSVKAEETELSLDLNVDEPTSVTEEKEELDLSAELDLSDFDYTAEAGERSPADDRFDAGDMELEFQIEDEEQEAPTGITTQKLKAAPLQAEPLPEPEEAPIAEKAAPAPAPAPQKRRVSKLLIAILLLTIIVGAGYIAYVLLDGMGIKIPYISELTKPEVQEPGALYLTTFDINSKFVDNAAVGKLFVITGKIKNGYPEKRGLIYVEGKLFTQGKKLSKTENVYAGNLLSDLDLANLDLSTIQKRLTNKLGDKQASMKVEPGKAIPFMVVFSNLPEAQLEEFTIEVKKSMALE